MTKVSFKKVALGFLSLSLIATDAFGNMTPPVPVTQTNINIRVSQQGYRPMPLPQPGMPQPMPMPMPGPMGPHGMGGVPCPPRPQCPSPCGREACEGGGQRSCGGGGHCRARIRGCMRLSRGCGGGGGARVRVSVNIRAGGRGGCFGRGRRC